MISPGLDAGGVELVDGLTVAFAVRAIIQQAVGTIMVHRTSTAEQAYATLRLRAADSDVSLLDTARAVLDQHR